MDLFRLDGKTAVVTGAGSGIGEAIATLFAQQGAGVEILERDRRAADQVADEIRRIGGTATSRQCDVSDMAEVQRVIDAICVERKSIEILVNNAGIAHVGNVLNTEEADFERIFRVNVKGVYHCLKACVAKMVMSGGGVILNMASIVSLVGIPDRFAYSMSKGAVLTMTYSIAVDFLKHNIRCNCICPARIHTPFVDGFIRQNYPGREKEMMEKLSLQQPVGRMGTPQDVAALALYLCSDEASFVTGAAYPLDGGVIHLR